MAKLKIFLKEEKMTNQNVITSDVKSRSIDMLVAIINPETLALIKSIRDMSQRKFRKRLEFGGGKGGAKVNAWVDSMRASSPTRVKSNPSVPEIQERRYWNVST